MVGLAWRTIRLIFREKDEVQKLFRSNVFDVTPAHQFPILPDQRVENIISTATEHDVVHQNQGFKPIKLITLRRDASDFHDALVVFLETDDHFTDEFVKEHPFAFVGVVWTVE